MFLTTNIYWWCAHLVWKGQVWNLLYNHDLKVNIKMLHVMVWVLDPSTVTQEAEKVTVICVSGGDHSAHDGLWPSASTGLSHIIHPTWEVLYCTVTLVHSTHLIFYPFATTVQRCVFVFLQTGKTAVRPTRARCPCFSVLCCQISTFRWVLCISPGTSMKTQATLAFRLWHVRPVLLHK